MSDTTANATRVEKSPKDTFDELRDLVTVYAKQETVDPLKNLGRWIAFGLSGAVSMSIGLVLLGLGGLRALQTTTGEAFDGNLNWLPYLIMFVVLLAVLGLTGRAMMKRPNYGDQK